MTTPSLASVFLVKEDVWKQHWTSNNNRYNVGMLYDYAKSVSDPEDIPLDALKYGFEHTHVDEDHWSPEFVARCKEADLQYPILVVQDRHGKMWIADGNHRYGRAVMRGEELISGYIVMERDLPDKAIEPKAPGDDDESSHRRAASEDGT
jgi:hypothetical protein